MEIQQNASSKIAKPILVKFSTLCVYEFITKEKKNPIILLSFTDLLKEQWDTF